MEEDVQKYVEGESNSLLESVIIQHHKWAENIVKAAVLDIQNAILSHATMNGKSDGVNAVFHVEAMNLRSLNVLTSKQIEFCQTFTAPLQNRTNLSEDVHAIDTVSLSKLFWFLSHAFLA